ncbi:MAG: isoprenylcysteine carboxylmethyltransferase family protein [Gemmatimonadota bacterium]|nr:isoprenylcysteine carboxylmethyltransferase family protein [Gemmatimonadota bacterium]MDH5759532.1 isoprenylcysteine carboxylmethyltransferase family protein [Gemmatimonadota bacterium]
MPTPVPPHRSVARSAGEWIFRRRGYLPLALGGVLAWVVHHDPLPSGSPGCLPGWRLAGGALGTAGILLRGWVLGTVPPGTSGRTTRFFRAASLNTTAAYSLVRHPLYLANGLLWVGASAFTASTAVISATAVAWWAYHRIILVAEEAFLEERFGDAFQVWKRRTPRLFPRPGSWVPSSQEFRFGAALDRDHPAFMALLTTITVLESVREHALSGALLPDVPWRVGFVAGLALYLAVTVRRRLTREPASAPPTPPGR